MPNLENSDELIRQRNQEALTEANIRLQQEAYQKNLTVMYRTMLIALLAVFASITLGIIAIKSKPVVNVQPAPVQVIEQKVAK